MYLIAPFLCSQVRRKLSYNLCHSGHNRQISIEKKVKNMNKLKFGRRIRFGMVYSYYFTVPDTLTFNVIQEKIVMLRQISEFSSVSSSQFSKIVTLRHLAGYALVRPFLYFDHFHIFDLFCTSTPLLRPLYFVRFTSTSVLRPFVKSEFLIGREAQVEVQFWSK